MKFWLRACQKHFWIFLLCRRIHVADKNVSFCLFFRRRRLAPVWAGLSVWRTRSSYTRQGRFSWGPLRSRAGRLLHRCSTLRPLFFTTPARGQMTIFHPLRAPPRDPVGWVQIITSFLLLLFKCANWYILPLRFECYQFWHWLDLLELSLTWKDIVLVSGASLFLFEV